MPSTANDPLPVLPLDYAKPGTVPHRRGCLRVAQWSLVLAAIDLTIGWLLIPLVDAETVIVTAPVLFILGMLLGAASWVGGVLPATMLGLAHCSICLLFTMLVNVRNWSPNEATLPFTIMGGAYVLTVALPVSAVAFLRMRRMAAAMATPS